MPQTSSACAAMTACVAQPILHRELFKQRVAAFLDVLQRGLIRPIRGTHAGKNRAFIIVMQLLISMSCRAGLVTLLELLKLVLLLRVRLSFTFSVFLQLIFPFSLVLKPEQKLDTPLPKRGFTEDRAAGSSLFRRRSRSCLRDRLFFLSFVFFSWAKCGANLDIEVFKFSVAALATFTASFSSSLRRFVSFTAVAFCARLDMTAVRT